MGNIKLHDKEFELFISEVTLTKRIEELAEQINKDYRDNPPLVIGVMNGVFVFASDLYRELEGDVQITFVRLMSYQGLKSTGNVVSAIGLEEDIKDRDVLLLEDIIDTGRTLHSFLQELVAKQPKSIKIATLLFKPSALQYDLQPNYIGFEIENKFVVGYGLDYNGLGRNLKSIYQLAN
ncbi:MAG: hypoxanthine phosphoribosyltransferase [Flavipsychrobacter sp.]